MPAADLPTLAEELALLTQVGTAAGEIALSFFGKDPQIWMKSGNSPVSEADLAVDHFLKTQLIAARPDYGWLSEEMPDMGPMQKRRRSFIIDPIDGTRGFLEGSQYWCISLAIIEDGRPVAGVLQCPTSGDIYAAYLGGGATYNNQTIHCTPHSNKNKWLVSAASSLKKKLPAPLSDKIEFFRHVPSLAYRLALAASGKIDIVFVRPNCHDWDIAAADLILKEAGGILLKQDGLPVTYGVNPFVHGFLIGAQEKTCKDILTMVRTIDFG